MEKKITTEYNLTVNEVNDAIRMYLISKDIRDAMKSDITYHLGYVPPLTDNFVIVVINS